MPETKSTMIDSAVFTAANAANIPLSFEQGINQAPSGTKITVTPTQFKLTDASQVRRIPRDAVIGRFLLNPPHREELIVASRLYSIIREKVENWDRTHLDSFFDTRIDLLRRIVTADEMANLTTAQMKRMNRILSARLAEFYIRYSEVKMMQTASLLNAISLTRLNGDERAKAISRDLRWSWINGHANRYQRYPSFFDDENYLIDNTRLAVGKTTYGADIVCFGQWVTDVYGNKAMQSLPLEEMIVTKSDSASGYSTIGFEQHGEDSDAITSFLTHLNMINNTYGQCADQPDMTGAWDIPNSGSGLAGGGIPTMPKLENPYLLVGSSENNARSASGHTNTKTERFQHYARYNIDDNLTARIWQCYDVWTDLLEVNFPEMADPQSDKVLFATELGIIKASTKIEDILKMVRANKAWTMDSLAKAMTYRDGSAKRPVTATIFRFAPVFPDNNVSYVKSRLSGSEAESDFIKLNYDRFHLWDDDPRAVLAAAQEWPHITPSTFQYRSGDENISYEPCVLNTVPTFGTASVPNSPHKRRNTLTGRNGVVYDLAKFDVFSNDADGIEAFGVTQSVFSDSISIADGAFLFEERPNQVYYNQLPLIDNTDPFQCGFDVMISHDDPQDNAWAAEWKTANNKMNTTSVVVTSEVSTVGGITEPAAPCYAKTSSTTYPRENLANNAYLAYRKHAFVFVGGDIFNHPVFRFSHPYVDSPVSFLHVEGFVTTLQEYLKRSRNGVPDLYETVGDMVASLFSAKLGGFIIPGDQATEVHTTFVSSFMSAIYSYLENNAAAQKDLNLLFSDPAYGPVNIIFSLPPSDLSTEALPLFQGSGEGTPRQLNDLGSNERLTAEVGVTEISTGSSGGNAVQYAQTFVRRLPSSGTIAPNAWIWFITKLVKHYAFIEADRTVSPSGRDAIVRVFGDQNDWFEHLTSKLTAMYVNCEKQTPFWAPVKPQMLKLAFSTTETLPTSDIMAEPREIRSTKSNVDHRSFVKPTENLHAQFEAGRAFFGSQNHDDGGRTDRNDSSSSKGGNRRRNRKRGRSTEVAPTTISEAIIKEPSAVSKGQPPADSTTPAVDEKLNHERKQGSGERDNASLVN